MTDDIDFVYMGCIGDCDKCPQAVWGYSERCDQESRIIGCEWEANND